MSQVNLDDLSGLPEVVVEGGGGCGYFEAFDALLVKSNWRYTVDEFARKYLSECAVPR